MGNSPLSYVLTHVLLIIAHNVLGTYLKPQLHISPYQKETKRRPTDSIPVALQMKI